MGTLAETNRVLWSGTVEDNAYWLLKINSGHVGDAMMTDQPPIAYVDLCAKGPEGTTIDFTLSANGGYMMQSSPLQLETAQEGDPPHTGCSSIWRIDWGDEAIVDESITADSITEVYEVEQILVWGGLDADTTLVAQDSITTRHDGITGALILFELLASP